MMTAYERSLARLCKADQSACKARIVCLAQNTTGGPVSKEFSFVSAPVTGPASTVKASPIQCSVT